MVSGQDQQVEKLLDEALRRNKFQVLEEFLLDESKEGTNFKCSKQFISKLDKLMNRELDNRNVKHASLGLTILHKFGETLIFPGSQGISALVSEGLVKKWFYKMRDLWANEETQKTETLLNLAEDFFDVVMVVHESGKEGTYQITEHLLHPIGKLASENQVNIFIQKEAVRKLNVILGKMPGGLKKEKKILSTQEASSVMDNLASRILKAGDYDFQIALMEALCRMASPAQRKELADHWFSMQFVAQAFSKIRDCEFETDCRKFLNLVNGMQGDARSVYSYPCLQVFLDNHELLMPADEKLEEFWIDFNLGSQSISFYLSSADEDAQDGQWDTLCIGEKEVYSYTVDELKGRKVLKVVMKDPVCVTGLEGSQLHIHFSPCLDILQATKNVFGEAKNKKFVKKTSVVNTTVQIIMDGADSQVLFSESQVSPTQHMGKDLLGVKYCPLPPDGGSEKPPLQMITPIRRKLSESNIIISSSAGSRTAQSPFSCIRPALTPASRTKVKPALQLMSSSERTRDSGLKDLMTTKTSCSLSPLSVRCESGGKQMTPTVAPAKNTEVKQNRQESKKFHRNIPVDKVLEIVQADQKHENEALGDSVDIVPDSQPALGNQSLLLPGPYNTDPTRRKISELQSLLPPSLPKLGCSVQAVVNTELPRQTSSGQHSSVGLSHKQLHTQLTQKLEQVLRERELEACGAQSNPKTRSGTAGHRQTGKWSGGRRKGQAQSAEDTENQDPTPTKPVTETIGSNKEKTIKPDTGKDKKAMTLTNSMVKQISSRYKSTAKAGAPKTSPLLTTAPVKRSFFNKSWQLATTGKGLENSSLFLKSSGRPKKTSDEPEDVYEFKADTPKENDAKHRRSLEKPVVESSVLSDSLTLNTSAKIAPPQKSVGRHVKKHLFSDTDTDNVTEVSWLRASNRKPKPKITDYTRQPAKSTCPAANTADGSLDLTSASPKPEKHQARPKRMRQKKATEDNENKNKALTAGNRRRTGRPQRAVTHTKSYREASDSDSLSESEKPPAHKKCTFGQFEKKKADQTARLSDKTSRKELDTTTRQHKKSHKIAADVPLDSHKIAEGVIGQPEENEKKHLENTFEGNERNLSNVPEQRKRKRTTPEERKRKAAVPQQSAAALKVSWTDRFDSLCPSPPATELMRSAEKSVPSLKSAVSPLQSLSVSPPVDSTPVSPVLESPSPVKGIQASSFYKNRDSIKSFRAPSLPSVTPVIQTPRITAKEPSATEEHVVSPVLSVQSFGHPLITSTGREKSTLPSLLKSPDLEEQLRDFMASQSCDKESVISVVTLSQSSHYSLSNVAMLHTEQERTPLSSKRSDRGKSEFQPGPIPSRKRRGSLRSASLSEEEDASGGEDRVVPSKLAVKMKPRKLFKANEMNQAQRKKPQSKQDKNTYMRSSLKEEEKREKRKTDKGKCRGASRTREKNCGQTRSSSDRDTVEDVEVHSVVSSCVLSSCWEGSVEADPGVNKADTSQEMSYVCRQFSSELQRKFQSHSRRMDLYTQQSLKTVQHHMSAISVQVHNHRFQGMEKVKQALKDEIRNLEQDDSTLKAMEEELTSYWKKQALALHTYQERGTRRLQFLRNTVQTNVYHSLELEEAVFTSEMCLMKKDMKTVQDKFFKEMHEEAVLSVRRGLQTLFLSETSTF